MKDRRPILLIEDDLVDAMALKRAVKDLKIPNKLITVGDGEQALAYLRNSANELPGLILLDINMPRMNGIEFLQVAKKEDRLKRIPVVVLTTSKEEQDRLDTFGLGVAGYMVKPPDYSNFVDVVAIVDRYWSISEFPSEG